MWAIMHTLILCEAVCNLIIMQHTIMRSDRRKHLLETVMYISKPKKSLDVHQTLSLAEGGVWGRNYLTDNSV